MADTQLLPCPFCGNKAELHEEFRSAGHRAIECAECGANVGAVDLERGIEMWNRRAALASRPAEVDDEAVRLRKVLVEVRHSLQFANDNPGGGISDTLWMMHDPETVFDFIDAALEAAPSHTTNKDGA